MPRKMSEEHRQANQRARMENKAVGAYLKAIENNRPRRGRQPTTESIQRRLDELAEEYKTASPLKRVQIIQRRMDLEKTMETIEEVGDITELEDDFVQMVATYSERKNISYAAWREMGVPVAVLQRGGLTRASSSSRSRSTSS